MVIHEWNAIVSSATHSTSCSQTARGVEMNIGFGTMRLAIYQATMNAMNNAIRSIQTVACLPFLPHHVRLRASLTGPLAAGTLVVSVIEMACAAVIAEPLLCERLLVQGAVR